MLNGVGSGTDPYTKKKYFNDIGAVVMKFATQLQILQAGKRRFESRLFDIRQVVQADLFDSELEGAKELAKHWFLRAAGAIAGVILEKHLIQVTTNHRITLRKKAPTIADLNEALKNESILDIPPWRQIQRHADIRNLCDHSKEREPTKDEVSELISGTDRFLKTLF